MFRSVLIVLLCVTKLSQEKLALKSAFFSFSSNRSKRIWDLIFVTFVYLFSSLNFVLLLIHFIPHSLTHPEAYSSTKHSPSVTPFIAWLPISSIEVCPSIESIVTTKVLWRRSWSRVLFLRRESSWFFLTPHSGTKRSLLFCPPLGRIYKSFLLSVLTKLTMSR